MTADAERRVIIDLQAAQSPHYSERGIARYCLEFADAILATRPDLVRQMLLNPRFPALPGLDRLVGRVAVSHRPDWPDGPAILHVMSPYELDIPIQEIWPREASRFGARLVVTVYDFIPEVFADTYLQDPGLRRRYRARHELVRAADHVLTISESAGEDTARLLGVPEGRITVVGSAPAEFFGPPADRGAAARHAIEGVDGLSDPFLVYNGAIEPRKNIEGLIEAFAAAGPQVTSRWQLVVACKLQPSQRNHLEVMARRLGIEGRLVLPGFVPDTTLRLLYQGCDLMVFPSIYEGFGLPIAEALSCGAPTLASGTSSMTELVAPGATFDPCDTEQMARAITRALTDTAWRSDLLAWAQKPLPGWKDVAAKTADVYEKILALPADGASRWRSRPLVAMVTPWPPQRTGVADYSRRLVDAMEADFDVEVFVDGDAAEVPDPPLVEPTGSVPDPYSQPVMAPAKTLPAHDLAAGGYDVVILTLGNSEFHAGALKLLREHPGKYDVLAHDVRVPDLYVHGLSRGAVPEGFEAAARRAYPSVPASAGFEGDLHEVAQKTGLYMVREVVHLARSVFTTSCFAAEVARLDSASESAERVVVWPYAYPAPVERDPSLRSPCLVCSFGLIHQDKGPDLLVRAVARLHERRKGVRLAFVGPVSAALQEEIQDLATFLGISDAVTITGDVDDLEYEAWLQRATVTVQLRRRSNGETSGAVADCLAHGIPTVVSDLGPQSELPTFVAKVPPDANAERLAEAIDDLLNEDSTGSIPGMSLDYVRANGFPAAATLVWDLVPELRSWPGRRV